MLNISEIYQDRSSNEPKPWKLAPNTTGLYLLANPYALDESLYQDLEANLEAEPDSTYVHPSGWTYRVKMNRNRQLYIMGWKTAARQGQGQGGGGQQQRRSYPQKTYSSGSSGPSAKTPPQIIQQEQKKFVDVELKYTDNISTVNEILANGYLNGEIWRYEGVVNLPTLENPDAGLQNIPHFLLIRSRPYVERKQQQHSSSITPDATAEAGAGGYQQDDYGY